MEVMIEVAMKIMKVEANNGDVGGGGFGDGGGVRKIGGIMKIVKSVKNDVLPKKKFFFNILNQILAPLDPK